MNPLPNPETSNHALFTHQGRAEHASGFVCSPKQEVLGVGLATGWQKSGRRWLSEVWEVTFGKAGEAKVLLASLVQTLHGFTD